MAEVDSWYQGVLELPEVAEMRIRIGWIPSAQHLQWQVEMVNPVTQERLALSSGPHRSWHPLSQELWEELTSYIREQWTEYSTPI